MVLACGPDDLHRVGLDAFAVMLAHRDWDVRVLGSQVPTEDLAEAAASIQPEAAVVTSHMRYAPCGRCLSAQAPLSLGRGVVLRGERVP